MPLNKDKILRYKVLDECFRDTANYYNMNRLHQAVNREVMRVYDKTVSIRTIQEDVKVLQFSPYNVVFDDDLREQRYYRYADPNFKLNIVQSLSKSEQSAIRDTIKLLRPKVGDFEKATPLHYYMYLCLQNIAIGNTLTFDFPSVEFENNGELAGMNNFEELARCVMNKQPIIITYCPFWTEEKLVFKVHPYLLKQYNGRWYLISHPEGVDYQIATHPIDRIRDVKLWKKAFIPPSMDMREYFNYTTGVTIDDSPVERIVLKISNSRYKYVETKPFGEDQKEVRHDEKYNVIDEEYHIIKFKMRINKEFVSLLLSFGDDLEVLEPQSLRDMMAEKIIAMGKKYSVAQKDCTDGV